MHEVVETIAAVYAAQGNHSYGENISQIEHAVQCAELAIRDNESPQLIAAALMHDIGHLLAATDVAFGNYRHDAVGADYLAKYFPAELTEPVRLHAQAKRYLCTVEPGYFERLSEASVDSLNHQGGLMDQQEQLEFKQGVFFQQAIKLRRWDDEGKIDELSKQGFNHYLPYIEDSLTKN